MNKNLIALAVAAATFSGAASAATVYSDDTSSLAIGGRVEGRAYINDQQQTNKVSTEVTDKSRVRINIDAKTTIADGIQGIGFFEKEFGSNSKLVPEDIRYAYVGVNSNKYGQIVYGKADGSLGMVTDFTDIMAVEGGSASNKITAADRTSNNLAYAGTFNNLTFKANYVFGGAKNSNVDNVDDVHGFSTGVKYNIADTGLALGLGYAEQKGQYNNDTHKGRAEQTLVAASYTVGDLYFAGLYQNGRRNSPGLTNSTDAALTTGGNNTNGYEVAAAYTMGKALFTTTYNKLEDSKLNKDIVDAVAVDGTYFFNSNFRAYASYQFNMLNKADVGKVAASDEVVLGARYDF